MHIGMGLIVHLRIQVVFCHEMFERSSRSDFIALSWDF